MTSQSKASLSCRLEAGKAGVMISKYGYDTSNGILPLPGSTDSRPSLWSGGGCSAIRHVLGGLESDGCEDGREAEHQGADVFLDRYQMAEPI